MSQLQWILLVLGVAVIAGVYWYTRRSGRRDFYDDVPTLDEVDETGRDEPAGRWADDPDLLNWPEDDPGPAAHDDEPPAVAEEPPAAPWPEPEEPVSRRWFKRLGGAFKRSPEETAPPSRAAELSDEEHVRMPRAPRDDEKLVVLHVMAREGLALYGDQVHAALESCKLQFGPRHIYHRVKEVDGVPESVFSVANMFKPGYLDPAESDELVTRGLSLFMVVPGPEDAVPAFRDMLGTARELAQALDADVHDDKRQPLTRQMAQFLQEEVAEVERRHRVANLQGH